MTLSRPLSDGRTQYVAARLVGQGLEFVAMAVLARRLGPSSFGSFSIAYLIARYLGLIGDWGASVRGVRDVSLRGVNQIGPLLVHRRRATAIAVVVFLLGASVSSYPAVTALAGVVAGRGLQRDWVALGLGRTVRSGIPQVVQGFGMAVVGVTTTTFDGAVVSTGVVYVVALIVSLRINPVGIRPNDQELDGPDAWMLVNVLADQVTSSADTLLLGALSTTREAGIYNAIYRIPSGFLTVVGLVVLASVPRVSKRRGGDTEDWTRANALARRASWPVFLLAVPVSVVGTAVFGSDYGDGRAPLALLLLGTAFAVHAAPFQPLALLNSTDRSIATLTSLCAGINVVGNLLLIPRFSMTGAAFATVISQVVLAFGHRRLARGQEVYRGDGSGEL